MSRLLIIKEKEIGAQVADLQAISELALPIREVQEGSHNRPCPLPQRSRGRAGFPAPQQRVELLPDRSVRSAGESGRGVRVHRPAPDAAGRELANSQQNSQQGVSSAKSPAAEPAAGPHAPSVGASGFEPPTSWSRSGTGGAPATTKCSIHAAFWHGCRSTGSTSVGKVAANSQQNSQHGDPWDGVRGVVLPQP